MRVVLVLALFVTIVTHVTTMDKKGNASDGKCSIVFGGDLGQCQPSYFGGGSAASAAGGGGGGTGSGGAAASVTTSSGSGGTKPKQNEGMISLAALYTHAEN